MEAMRFTRPGLYEYQTQAAMEYVFRSQGSPRDGYPAIVGSGANSCILHYISNRDPLKDGDLLLIDAGAEYDLYSADITRTWPVNEAPPLATLAPGIASIAARSAERASSETPGTSTGTSSNSVGVASISGFGSAASGVASGS